MEIISARFFTNLFLLDGDIRIEKQISNCHPPCVFTVYPPGNLRSSPSLGAPGVIE
jgi:hypothetical protein